MNDDATGAGTGLTWEDAFNYVQEAADVATSGENIWVAEGTYTKLPGADPSDSVLVMVEGVKVYGGFIGNEVLFRERGDPADHPTILDGEDTSYHVVIGASNVRLDGFTITGGNASEGDCEDDNSNGAGMFNKNVADVKVHNCIFIDNFASGYGGGMSNLVFLNEFDCLPVISNCAFINNTAGDGNKKRGYGGGMYNLNCDPIVIGCVFMGNTAVGYMRGSGGGMRNEYFACPTIVHCDFIGNSAGNATYYGAGGGMSNDRAFPTITNCIFRGNSSTSMGGGISTDNEARLDITNCTFSGNSSIDGGGVHVDDGSHVTLLNCILWGDSAPNGPELMMDGHWGSNGAGTSILTVDWSDVEGGPEAVNRSANYAILKWRYENNIDGDPLFVSPTDLHLSEGSPCIDSGRQDAEYNDPDGSRNDMGAYGGPWAE